MRFIIWIAVTGIVFALNSCNDDDKGYSLGDLYGSIATVRPLSEDSGSYSLTLDDGTSLWPAANYVPWYKPKENQRVIVYYTLLSEKFQQFDYAVLLRNIGEVLTKYPAENLGKEANDEKYGTDPVKIVDMWIGDGYLNIKFGFNYGGAAKHFINLIQREDTDTPYSFEFRHHAYNDASYTVKQGLVAFNLSKLNIEKETELTVRVKTFEGEKEYTVSYNPARNDTEMRSFTKEDRIEIE
jgi:hypothetical protein